MSSDNHDDTRTGMEIAVIGMDGRFPGAPGTAAFWENLSNGVESIRFFSGKELLDAGVEPAELEDPAYVKARGYLEGAEYFDAAFFGYTPNEADTMDPQLRLLHQCAWHALEDAGYNPESYNGFIGFYAGAKTSFIWQMLRLVTGKETTSHLTDKDFIATHVSYALNLKGPSFTMASACSTSLLAVTLACQGLLSGECDMALAGGVSINLPQVRGYRYSKGMIASPDGHCRAFDADAEGTVFGDGVGLVVLKMLDSALEDGDHIYAVIKGFAVNNDGSRKVGYTAPSVDGQAEALKAAYQMAEVAPESVTYIEAHGTGTPLGDPVEIEALKLAFDTDKKNYCAVGSLKTNVGHLDGAAGIGGLIKTVLSLYHRQIPPSLHFKTPNPKIDFDNSPFFVNTQLREWHNPEGPLRAGVSSFGIGGTNAHVILEGAPPEAAEAGDPPAHEHALLLLSAATETALDRAARNLAQYAESHPGQNLADVAYTLQVGRKALPYRRSAVCAGAPEIQAAFGGAEAGTANSFHAKIEDRPVIFMFPGQGAQYVNMGLELYTTMPLFREELDRCFQLLGSAAPGLREILYPADAAAAAPPEDAPVNRTQNTQPIIFAFEYALAKLLMSWGIEPEAMIGHSIGEYTAACLSGVLSLEDALQLVALRGQSMQQVSPGSMLSVSMSEKELQPLLEKHDNLALAAANSSALCVVSGPHDAIEAFDKQLQQQDIDTRRLHTSHAFHSQMMDPILDSFKEKVSRVTLNPPQIPFISNVSGRWIRDEEAMAPAYWSSHIRRAVRFSRGLEELFKEENAVFVEIGPGKGLSAFVTQHERRGSTQPVLNLIKHPKEEESDTRYLLSRLGQLWLFGIPVDWKAFYGKQFRRRVPLPTYPFEEQPFSIEGDPYRLASGMSFGGGDESQLLKRADISQWFYLPSWESAPPPPGPGKKESAVTLDGPCLMFTDQQGLGAQLAESLQKAGNQVVTVSAAGKFEKTAEGKYNLNPRDKYGYRKLAEHLEDDGIFPRAVLHLWGVTPPEDRLPGPKDLEAALDGGFYSLVFFTRALAEINTGEQPVRLMTVFNQGFEITGDEDVSPLKALFAGPCRVIPQEFPHLHCSAVDVRYPQATPEHEQTLVSQLLQELRTTAYDPVVAFRGSRRWAETFRPLPLEEVSSETPYLREKGIYLITGGLGDTGGMGYMLARFLAERVKARLVLASRSQIPPRDTWSQFSTAAEEKNPDPMAGKIKRLKELEELGAEVLTLSADISQPPEVDRLIAAVEEQWGPINGVIHAAAVKSGKSMSFITEEITPAQYREQFTPKLAGTLALYHAFRGKAPDFLLLTSSLASVMGPFAAYAASNAFLDTFALRANRDNPGDFPPLKVINWDNWYKWGDPLLDNRRLAMSPEEGFETFHRIMTWEDAPRILVSTADLNLRMKKFFSKETAKKKDETPVGTRKKDIADWFYAPSWTPAEIPLPQEDTAQLLQEKNTWLVFTDGSPLGEQIRRRLEEHRQTLLTVSAGSTFETHAPGRYSLEPGRPEHYGKLFEELSNLGHAPTRILHLWGVTGPYALTLEELEQTQDTGLYSLINIAQAIGTGSMTQDIRLVVVTDHMQPVTPDDTLCPAKATVLGPVKVIPLEYSNITCRSVDVPTPHGASSPKQVEESAGAVIRECFGDSATEPVVAYRGGERRRLEYRPEKIKAGEDGAERLKNQGIYLVTGGLGGMGFTIAQHLASTFKARIALVDKTAFPGRDQWPGILETTADGDETGAENRRKIQSMLQLEEAGAQFLLFNADVAGKDAMETVISRTEEQLGPLNGIIHTAGQTDFAGVIQRRTREKTAELLEAKVKGTLVLTSLLEGKNLDFFLLFSSLGNIIYTGKFGQAGYNAGHEFLDVYAYELRRKGIFALTLNWNDWFDVGIAAEAAKRRGAGSEAENRENDVLTVTPEQGVQVFARALGGESPRLAVSHYDLNKMLQYMYSLDGAGNAFDFSGEADRGDGGGQFDRPELSSAFAPPANPIEQTIADIWKRFFGYRQVGTDDDFFELGGNSVNIIKVANQVNKALDVEMAVTEFFLHTTIRKLAEKVFHLQLFKRLNCIVRLNNSPSPPNFFIIHQAKGAVHQYKELAGLLEQQCNVFGVQARGISGAGPMPDNPEELLEDYLKELQAVQNEGPYTIGGYCIGTAISFEMAGLMEARNHQVKTVVLFSPVSFTLNPDSLGFRWKKTAMWAANNVKIFIHALLSRGKTSTPDNTADGKEKPSEADILKNLNDVVRRLKISRKINADLVIVKAEEAEHTTTDLEHWRRLTNGKVTLLEVPGTHHTLLDPPNVNRMAEQLQEALAAAQTQ